MNLQMLGGVGLDLQAPEDTWEEPRVRSVLPGGEAAAGGVR